MRGAYLLERRGAQVVYATRVPDAKTRAQLEQIAWKAFRVDKGTAAPGPVCGVPPKSAKSGTNAAHAVSTQTSTQPSSQTQPSTQPSTQQRATSPSSSTP